MFNSKKYYLIPLEEITDQMIEDAIQTSRETLMKSIRPLDGKIHALIKFTGSKPVPDYMVKYKQYDHESILKAINTPEWNLKQPIHDLIKGYNFNKIISDFNSGYLIESYGQVYITIFQILKFKFFTHSLDYLNSEQKWKVFKGNRFEESNEFTMLELNFFYDLISEEEKVEINEFRNKRNSISHSFKHEYEIEDLRISLISMDKIIQKYFSELEI